MINEPDRLRGLDPASGAFFILRLFAGKPKPLRRCYPGAGLRLPVGFAA